MRSGITFPVFVDLLRDLYVDVAVHALLTDERARTDSRISLMTGIHRKEIRRSRGIEAKPSQAPAVVTVTSQIIARWLAAPWANAEGAPRPLPRTATDDAPSFERLVGSVTTDVRPRAVLDDLLDQGIVTIGEHDEQLFYFARNLHDHIAAAAANVAGAVPAPYFDRSVHYDRLTEEAANRIEAASRVAAQDLLVRINRLAAAEADQIAPDAAPQPQRRINFGIYIYIEDEPANGEG
jgi:hypothetical protein